MLFLIKVPAILLIFISLTPPFFEALIAFLPNGGFMSIDQIVQLACLPNSYIVVLHRNFKI